VRFGVVSISEGRAAAFGALVSLFGIILVGSAATAAIPTARLTLYQQAATTRPGLPWTVLAAIGTIESDNGQPTLPGMRRGAKSAGGGGADAARACEPLNRSYERDLPDLLFQCQRFWLGP
jgi:hypothetical protein